MDQFSNKHDFLFLSYTYLLRRKRFCLIMTLWSRKKKCRLSFKTGMRSRKLDIANPKSVTLSTRLRLAQKCQPHNGILVWQSCLIFNFWPILRRIFLWYLCFFLVNLKEVALFWRRNSLAVFSRSCSWPKY